MVLSNSQISVLRQVRIVQWCDLHPALVDRRGVWLAPWRGGEPQPLSAAGSHILRGMLWYAALTKDPGLGPGCADAIRHSLEGEAERRLNFRDDSVRLALSGDGRLSQRAPTL
jgi:hypothetical protein